MPQITIVGQEITIARELHRTAKAMWKDELDAKLHELAIDARAAGTDDLPLAISQGIYRAARDQKVPGWRNLGF